MRLGETERRLLGLGVAVGAVAGVVWAAGRLKPVQRDGHPALIDWDRVQSVAAAVNRRDPALGDVPALEAGYRALVARCVPLIAQFTHEDLPRQLDTVHVFGRNDWIHANITNFQRLLEPIERLNQRTDVLSMRGGQAVAAVNQVVLSGQVGLLLGYLSRRVLGQYDLALLGKETLDAGKVYFVEPNIVHVQQELGLSLDDFRMWIALHETTHAFEFEAHPWLQRRFNELLVAYFGLLEEEIGRLHLGVGELEALLRRLRERRPGAGHWLGLVMSPAQRTIFLELQAIMCILEGYSNYVMNGIGRDLLPGYDLISQRIAERQRNRGLPERLFVRLTGLDMKLEQYVLGERFILAVVEKAGKETLAALWTGPDSMPTMDEIRAPDAWIARVVSGMAASSAGNS